MNVSTRILIMPLYIDDIILKGDNDIEPVFDGLINLVKNDPMLFKEAKKYNLHCIKKYKKSMNDAMEHTLIELKFNGLRPIVQSSYSADVYIDDACVDLDVVVLYDNDIEYEHAKTTAKKLGYNFLETRNADQEHMIHDVFVRKYSLFEVELKIRCWKHYKEHLYKIHKYLDALPKDVRMIWRYIRSQVINREIQLQKKVKYLWYMYGAIKTGVDVSPKYFAMNIYYSST